MRRLAPAAVLLAAAGVAPAVAAAGRPVAVTVSAGPVAVTLAGSGGTAGPGTLRDARDLTVAVTRDGAVARAAAPLHACRYGCDAAGPTGYATASIADLDGDGEPEVLVDRADGATPCCTSETAILRRDPATGAYRELDVRFGASYVLRAGGRLVPSGRRVLGDDVRFAEAFAPRVAGVYLPARVYALRGGRIEDVTVHARDLVAPHFRRLTRDLRNAERRVDRRRSGGHLLLRAVLPAWVAEARRLGRGGVATRRLASEVHRHRISDRFRREVRAFVRARGY